VQSSSQIITTNRPTSSFLQAGWPSCCPTNSVKALKGKIDWFRLIKRQAGVAAVTINDHICSQFGGQCHHCPNQEYFATHMQTFVTRMVYIYTHIHISPVWLGVVVTALSYAQRVARSTPGRPGIGQRAWAKRSHTRASVNKQLHCALSLAAQCICIGPLWVCLFVCVFVCGSVTTITRNCVHRSSSNWICR